MTSENTSDIYSETQRSELMSRVRSKNSKPELQVRSWLHKNGYRFRLHKRNLPGCPDIVLTKYNAVIFVHGCFWHQHLGCKKATIPRKNREFWKQKLTRNVERDQEVVGQLESQGWNVIIIWECDIRSDLESAMKIADNQLQEFMS